MSRLLNGACSPAGGVEKTCDFLPPRKLVGSTPWLRPECPYCPTVAIPSRQSIIILSSLGLFFLPDSRLARAELLIGELSVVVGQLVNFKAVVETNEQTMSKRAADDEFDNENRGDQQRLCVQSSAC